MTQCLGSEKWIKLRGLVAGLHLDAQQAIELLNKGLSVSAEETLERMKADARKAYRIMRGTDDEV